MIGAFAYVFEYDEEAEVYRLCLSRTCVYHPDSYNGRRGNELEITLNSY